MTKKDKDGGATGKARPLADLTALRDAFAGVTPLGSRDRLRVPRPPAGAGEPVIRGEAPDMIDADSEARRHLGALVAGGVKFEVKRAEDGRVAGIRLNGDVQLPRKLSRGELRPEAELDLHGYFGAEAEAEVVRFVRAQQKRGRTVVRIVHGKGLHSPDGLGVLREHVIRALTEGGAAPVVLAFGTAPSRQGGTGALHVRLIAL
ncbi:MAG: Smr/MutS family protein [Sandaracinaceae bacterium]|nr:Smr/MutS family protein [Sandaracinaceae bacterium]